MKKEALFIIAGPTAAGKSALAVELAKTIGGEVISGDSMQEMCIRDRLWVLDYTKTAMGGRLLRKWVEQPLIDREQIERRQDAVECFVQDMILSEELKEALGQIYDMERLMGRIAYGSAGARDLLSLKQSLRGLPGIKQILGVLDAPYFQDMASTFDDLADLYDLLELSLIHIFRTGAILTLSFSN